MDDVTFLILKSDCINRGLVGDVISRIEKKGFIILRLLTKRKTEAWCRQQYTHLANTPWIDRVITTMANQILIGIVVYGPDAIKAMRTMVGATDPAKAAPGTIRGDLACQLPWNLIHAADSR